jgi:hypothetical protein
VIIEAMREQTRQLAVLGLHTARLSRHFKETLKQLNDAQEKRRATEAAQLREAAALYQMDQKQGLPYNLAEDGFVFSAIIYLTDRHFSGILDSWKPLRPYSKRFNTLPTLITPRSSWQTSAGRMAR